MTIRDYIQSQLLEPLKRYPTKIQDTMIELITRKLEELYELTVKFPEIISPSRNRLDILQVIADQFVFAIRDEADLREQIEILDHILYVYNRRGSIDTIENMWKYYGGDLPKEIKVKIPSYNLFRYSVSPLSGTHVFPDGMTHRTGVYEIQVINSNYPIPKLREFLIRELVAAGNYIYFTNILHSEILNAEDLTNSYKYLVHENTVHYLQLAVLHSQQGLSWSGYNPLSKNSLDSAWSGRASLFLELTLLYHLDLIKFNTYDPDGFFSVLIPNLGEIRYPLRSHKNTLLRIENILYSAISDSSYSVSRHLYNDKGELIESSYPGYFILGESLLGKEVI